MRQRLRMRDQPKWHELSRKTRIMLTIALLLAAVTIVGAGFQDARTIQDIAWWWFVPFAIGFIMIVYNVPAGLRLWEQKAEAARTKNEKS